MNKYADTMRIIRGIREKTDTAVLFYSAGGKDGIALVDMLAGVFDRVICYYMWLVPNLDHIRPYIQWAESHPNVEVRQIRHWQRDTFDHYGFFQPGEGDPEVKIRKVGDVEKAVMEETGIPYAFSGMKGVDGYMKRMRLKMFARTGYVTDKGMVYPLALWTNAEVLNYIRNRGLIKPFVYTPKSVSQGFGLDLSTLLLLKNRFPRDYERTIAEFPFAEKVIYDMQNGILPNGWNKSAREEMEKMGYV